MMESINKKIAGVKDMQSSIVTDLAREEENLKNKEKLLSTKECQLVALPGEIVVLSSEITEERIRMDSMDKLLPLLNFLIEAQVLLLEKAKIEIEKGVPEVIAALNSIFELEQSDK